MPETPRPQELTIDETVEILREYIKGRPANKGPMVYRAIHTVLQFLESIRGDGE
jgi:hypothetical protein